MSGHSDLGFFNNFGASSVFLLGYKQILHRLLVLRNQARDDVHHVERENLLANFTSSVYPNKKNPCLR